MPGIRTKVEFYDLYNRSAIGNRLRNWTFPEWLKFDERGTWPVTMVAARCRTRAEAVMRHDLRCSEASKWVELACEQQPKLALSVADYQLAELAPDEINTLQGEVYRSPYGLYLRYTIASHRRMRESIHDAEHVWGLRAKMLIEHHMDSQSLDTLDHIWTQWPDSIVEFCCYERCLGELNCNTLFWEARDY